MPSSYTTRNRLTKEAPGENINGWGLIWNASGGSDMLDVALDGWATIALSGGSVTLTTANGADDQARRRVLKLTGTGGTVVIPSVEKWYLVTNTGSGDATITTGGGTTATVKAGAKAIVACDASNCTLLTPTDFGGVKITSVADPTNPQDVATKAYADALAFTANSGVLPGQVGSAGKFLTTNGTVASWGYPVTAGGGLATVSGNTLTVTAALASDVKGGADTTKAVTSGALAGSASFGVLTDASTVAWDVAAIGYNATITLGGNRVIGAPTNLQDGLTYTLNLVQDATGSRVPTWNALWDFGAVGAPILQTAAGKSDKVTAQYNATRGKLEATFWKGA